MLKELVKEKRHLINLRVTEEEEKAIRANAKKYAGGSYSAWIRYAAIKHVPSAKDLVKKS